MSLRVRSLETFPVGLPFRRPYVTATGTLERREMIIVRIRSEDGATGYGDAVPMSLRGGPGLDAVRADLADICAPLLPDMDPGDLHAILVALLACAVVAIPWRGAGRTGHLQRHPGSRRADGRRRAGRGDVP